MRALSNISVSEIPDIYKIDPVKTASVLREEKGMQIKKIAERLPASQLATKFEPLIIRQMARSAALLAQLWDQAYINAGSPKLAVYKSYKFPFQPEFVKPDYYPEKAR